jgi:hypothetical protein
MCQLLLMMMVSSMSTASQLSPTSKIASGAANWSNYIGPTVIRYTLHRLAWLQSALLTHAAAHLGCGRSEEGQRVSWVSGGTGHHQRLSAKRFNGSNKAVMAAVAVVHVLAKIGATAAWLLSI